jgi:lysine-N-methylase
MWYPARVSHDASTIPARPRLHDDVVVRRHLGEDLDTVVLHDERTGRVLRILPVQWQVLALADGTRDVEGLVLAGHARGIEIDRADLESFLAHLARERVLTEGVVEPIEPDEEPDADLLGVPLDAIDGWTFECTKRGVCCHVFPSILFTPLEAARARVLLPDEPHEHYPARGAPRDGGILAPVLVEGRCRYLDESGSCQLHARAGMDSKPAGCRAFPAQLVYDGERVRASTAFECACVVDGIGKHDGAPVVPTSARVLGDLPRPSRVGRVPSRVALDDARSASRDEVRAFFRALAASTAPDDVARGLWSLASSMDSRGLEGIVDAYVGPSAIDDRDALAWVARLAERLEAWRQPLASFRSANDLTRRAFDWMIAAARAVEREGLPQARSAREREVEAFAVRATAWVCRDALGRLPLVDALKARAVRTWIARALPAWTGGDPRASEPLTLVEVMFRAHGLEAFVQAESDALPRP